MKKFYSEKKIIRSMQNYLECKELNLFAFITYVALAKAGLVVGPFRPFVRMLACSSVRPSVRNPFGVPSLSNL